MLERAKIFFCGGDGSNNSTAFLKFDESDSIYAITKIVEGNVPSEGQRLGYVDGAFYLFTAGHISFGEAVLSIEKMQHPDLEPFLIVGIYDDTMVSKYKRVNWPVMNMVERALLLWQSRVSLKNPSTCNAALLR